jgi:hypothetical protein
MIRSLSSLGPRQRTQNHILSAVGPPVWCSRAALQLRALHAEAFLEVRLSFGPLLSKSAASLIRSVNTYLWAMFLHISWYQVNHHAHE